MRDFAFQVTFNMLFYFFLDSIECPLLSWVLWEIEQKWVLGVKLLSAGERKYIHETSWSTIEK
jgi:hypothetical protein